MSPDPRQRVLPQQESTVNVAHHYLQVHNTHFNTISNSLPHCILDVSCLYQYVHYIIHTHTHTQLYFTTNVVAENTYIIKHKLNKLNK